jgi:hypothetical protein
MNIADSRLAIANWAVFGTRTLPRREKH